MRVLHYFCLHSYDTSTGSTSTVSNHLNHLHFDYHHWSVYFIIAYSSQCKFSIRHFLFQDQVGGHCSVILWMTNLLSSCLFSLPLLYINLSHYHCKICFYIQLCLFSLPFLYQTITCGRTGGHCSCLLYTSPSPRDRTRSRMPSSA